MRPLRIFIGYDQREAVAYHVLSHSILTRASAPVTIAPLARPLLMGIHSRAKGPLDSTDFSITRFLVPYLSGYEGSSIFMDCDMLCLADIHEVIGLAQDAAVAVCKHDYVPRTAAKFLRQQQTVYPRKNWSSFMVFNNALCERLTPQYVNEAPGLDLHGFRWLDGNIAALPLVWNHLVGEDEQVRPPKIVHYTMGGPWFPEYRDVEYADLWRAEASGSIG